MTASRLPRFASTTLRSQIILNTSRTLSTTTRTRSQSNFSRGPAPPRLPKEEQELFEKLQSQSRGAFSSPAQPSTEEQKPKGDGSSFASWRDKVTTVDKKAPQEKTEADATDSAASASSRNDTNVKIEAQGTGAELHPHVRRGAKPEFEGDSNPKTGEVGGPKNEPLRWGHGGDWSYNGRVTDF